MSTRLVEGYTLVSSTDGLTAQGTKVAATSIQPGTPGALFDGGTAYGAGGPFYSVPIRVSDKDTVGLQFSCPATGSPLGSFIIQGCNDPGNQNQGGSLSQLPDSSLLNWSTLSFWDESLGTYVQSRAVSGAQSYGATIQVFPMKWFRIQWTNSSGTIKITARVTLRGDGGR